MSMIEQIQAILIPKLLDEFLNYKYSIEILIKQGAAASSQQLIQWIRGLNGQYCKQIKSFTDLKNGLVLGEIVAEELNPHNLANPNNCIGNLNNILCEIKTQCMKNGVQFPSHLLGITPAHLYEETESIQTLCEWLFLQKKLMQMKNNGTFQNNQQKNGIKRPPIPVQQQQNRRLNYDEDNLDNDVVMMTFQPGNAFSKNGIDQSHNSSQQSQSNKKQQNIESDDAAMKHNSSRSSEPELFYASDLNFVNENNHFESFNEESNKQNTFKSLENSYQVIRPSSPYQTGSFKSKQQNNNASKIVSFDQEGSLQKFGDSDQFGESRKSNNNYIPSSYNSSAQSSGFKNKSDKLPKPLQQQDLANSFDSQNNVMKVASYLNDSKNNKGSSMKNQSMNEDSLMNNISFQSKKGQDSNQYQENNQRYSNLQLPPAPNSSKQVKVIKPNQNHHQHSNSFNLQSNQQTNTSLYSNQSNSAQKPINTQISDRNKIQTSQKEVQKISANFSVNSSSGYMNSSLGVQGGIMNSQSKEKLKKEIEQLEQSIKEEQIIPVGSSKDNNNKKNKFPPQRFQSNQIEQQNSNRNIPNSVSSRLSIQSANQEQKLQRNNNSFQQLTKNRSNNSLIEPTQQPTPPQQQQLNNKKLQDIQSGNQSNMNSNHSSNANSRIRSYSHQHSASNTSEQAPSEIYSYNNHHHQQNNELSVFTNSSTNNNRQKQLKIYECNDQQKERCLKWLYEICLIKKDIKDIKDKLPKVCKNGVIYLDIINRIQGKEDTITGINRNTKNASQIRANYNKLFSYIRKFEKMNPRYLFNSEEYLIEGNTDVFWGFLDDLWHLFHSKQSPYDPRYENNTNNTAKQIAIQQDPYSAKKQSNAFQQQGEKYNEMLYNNGRSGQKQMTNINDQVNPSNALSNKYNPSSCSARIVKTVPNDPGNNSIFSKQTNNNQKQNPVLKTQGSSNNLSINGGIITNQQNMIFTPKYRNGSQNSPILSPKSVQNTNNDNFSQKINLTRQNTSNNLNQSYTSQRKSLTNLNANNSSYKKLSNYKDMHTQRQVNAVHQFNTPTRRGLSRRTSRDNLMNQSQSPSLSRQRINTVHTFNHNSVNYSNNNNNSFLKFNSQSKPTLNSNNNNNSFQTAFSPCTNRTPSKGMINGFNQMTPKVMAITLEMEMQTNQFLNKLGFNQYIVKKDKHLFEDPLRNGTILCKLVEKLNQRVDKYFTKPRNIEECRYNIESALQPLRGIQEHINIPFYLLFKTEEILKGDHDAIWGLLYNLMKNQESIKQSDPLTQVIINSKNDVYPQSNCASQYNNSEKNNVNNDEYNKSLFGAPDQYSPVSGLGKKNQDNYQGGQIDYTQEMHLPYSADEIRKLEGSLIQWINIKSNKQFTSFQPIYNSMKNGVLLCTIVSSILNRLIAPSHSQPTSDHNCLANIQKALVPLRNIKNIGQRFLWKENLILLSNQSVILGLLEDLRRYSDGLPARKGDNYFLAGPYFGLSLNKENQNPTDRNNTSNNSSFRHRKGVDSVTFSEDALIMGGDKIQLNQEMYQQQNLINKMNYQKPYSLFKENFSEGTFSSEQLSDNINYGIPQNQFINRAYQLIQENATNAQNQNLNQQVNSIIQKELHQQQKQKGLLDNFQQKQKQILEEHNNSSMSNIYNNHKENQSFSNQNVTFKPLQQQQCNKKEIENQTPSSLNILNWLNDIGLSDISKTLDLNQNHIQAFKDGLIICKIIEKLDQTRIPGLINNPKTSASCLVNIRKAFFILKKKTDFDSKLLLDETLVYEAKHHFVIAFLNQLKHSFKNQTLYLKKLKKNEQIRDISIMTNK